MSVDGAKTEQGEEARALNGRCGWQVGSGPGQRDGLLQPQQADALIGGVQVRIAAQFRHGFEPSTHQPSHPIRFRMLPRLAVRPAQQPRRFGIAHNHALGGIVFQRPAELHGDVGQDAARGGDVPLLDIRHRSSTRGARAAGVRFSAARRKPRRTKFRAPKEEEECETPVWAGRPNRHAGPRALPMPAYTRSGSGCCHGWR